MNNFESYMECNGMRSLARFEKEFKKIALSCTTREDLVEAYIKLKAVQKEFHNAQCAMWDFYNNIEESNSIVTAAKTISEKKDKIQTMYLACEKMLFNDDVFKVVSNYFSN